VDKYSDENLITNLKNNTFLNRKYNHEIDKLINHYKF
jgi:hypothetical protein